MSQKIPINASRSSVILDVNAGASTAEQEDLAVEPQRDDPFRILILGDFSGRDNRSIQTHVAERHPLRIDRDNFDEIFRRMKVQLNLRLGSGQTAIVLRFEEFSDFEPDSIFQRCELFQTIAAAPRPESAGPPPRESRGPVGSDAARLISRNLLDDIVEQAEASTPSRPRPKDEFQSVIDGVVAPHVIPSEDPASIESRILSDERNAILMRAILHHPDFQAIEAVWRAIFLLVRGLDTDGALSLHLLDLTKAELAQDLSGDRGGVFRLLVEETVQTPGGEPWSLVAGNYVFGRSDADLRLLGKLASISRLAGAPFLAESAAPSQASPGAEEGWRSLRATPEARWIGLSIPRFLARLPYGRDTYEIESFPFEEMQGRPEHGAYLWANPALACAYLLGRSFSEYGWGFRPGVLRQIDGLPLHSVEVDGEQRAQPCAEVLLTEREIEYVLDEGLMPLASVKNRDSVVLVRFQSIAEPPAALAGRWG
jgi:type VI secretion system protein ImpC